MKSKLEYRNPAKIYKDFFEFTKYQLEVKDSHPAYALLRELFKIEKLSLEQKIWRCLIFVTFDHLGSAATVWKKYPNPQIIKDPELMKTGIARRMFRGNLLWADMINSMQKSGNLQEFVESSAKREGIEGWKAVRNDFEAVKFNGPWASYKWADLLTHVCGYNLKADSIGENHCVLEAAELLTGEKQKEIMLDIELQNNLLDYALKHNSKIGGLEELETALCDFISFLGGRYYIGMEIDSQMEQMPDKPEWWAARAKAFDKQFLGECNGYSGIRKELHALYKNHGIIKWWK